MKQWIFSETIAASDLKGRRRRYQIRRYVSIEGQSHFLTLAQRRVRGLSQEVVDFFYNKKTIRFSAIKFYM